MATVYKIELTQEQKEVLHIAYVSESSLSFKTDDFGGTIDFDICNDKGFSIDLVDRSSTWFTKEQLTFILKWLSYSR